jgi:hypothetical protein
MNKIKFLLICFFFNFAFSHNTHYDKILLHHWSIEKENQTVAGSFYMLKNGDVYIEDANENIIHFPLSSFSKEDQAFVLKKNECVREINNDVLAKNSISEQENQSAWNIKLWIITLCMLLFGFAVFIFASKKKLKYIIPMLFVGSLMILYGFVKKNSLTTTTDPAFVNSAFTPFKSTVSTSWDNTYFYVNSKGIPNHTMMVGISSTGWQQQIPIPQCYIGTNAWSIPLNPVLATTPVPVSATHFLKGAIAVAANGVAIFNYHTNTGVDSFLDGQLDNYGGHCGRADDYHYHTAPMHLITLGQTTYNLPIAFGLDGFAVYGSLEPDGSPMETLDANHGHYGTNGVYHYHGTATAPYMIGNMVGKVVEDANLQIIPQASAKSVRAPGEGQNPLKDALITACVPNVTNNGYNLSFSYNGIPGSATNYSWNGTAYTFNYVNYPTTISINGVVTTPPNPGTLVSNRTGFAQCTVTNLATQAFSLNDNNISIYPNPVTDVLNIKVKNGVSESDIQSISIYGIKGELISKTLHYKQNIDIKTLSKGMYFVKIISYTFEVTKKLMVE